MSILIKNMKMPENCGECPFATPTRDGLKCDAVNFLAKCLVHPVTRMSCCPLVELPKHGRLIDADALHIQLIDKELDQLQPWISFNDYREVVQIIDDAPAIIETEE